MSDWRTRSFAVGVALLAGGVVPLPSVPPDERGQWHVAEILPPALGADVLIRAALADAAADRPRRLALAFDLASRAQELCGRVSRLQTLPESRAGYVSRSARLGLSRLALQARVVLALLPASPSTAIRLSRQVRVPELPPTSCDDPLIIDVSAYYDMAGAVLAHPSAAVERVHRLADLVEHIQSPVQLAPVARLLAGSQVGHVDFQRLVEAYSHALRRIRGGDPAFRYAVVSQRLPDHLEAVARKCRVDSYLSKDLLAAFRDFVTAHMRGQACHESFLPHARREIQTAVVEPYNTRFRVPGVLTRDGLAPIEIDETWPSDADNARPAWSGFWREGEAESLSAQLAGGNSEEAGVSGGLMTGPAGMASRISGWQRPAEMSEEDFFHQKLLLYRRFARSLKRGPERRAVVDGAIGFLAGSSMQTGAPAEWLWHVVALMRDDVLRDDVLSAVAQVSHPALRLYSELERPVRLPQIDALPEFSEVARPAFPPARQGGASAAHP